MSTITAEMPITASTPNASSSAKAGKESTQFEEIMKTQGGQKKDKPGKAFNAKEPDKLPGKAPGEAPGEAPDKTQGIQGNWQLMSLLLMPGMLLPKMPAVDDGTAVEENALRKPAPVDAPAAASALDERADGETKLQEPASDGQAEKTAVIPEADPDRQKENAEKSSAGLHANEQKPAVSKAADTALNKTAGAVQPATNEGQQKSQGLHGQKTAEISGADEREKPSQENAGLHKEPAVKDKQAEYGTHGAAIRGNEPEGMALNEAKAAEQTNTWKADIRPEYMNELKAKITDSLAAGKREFEIQLNPANLGKLVIKASYEAGRAVISIVCSETRTMEAMSQQARELAAMLEDRTGSHTIVVLEPPASDYLEQQGSRQQDGGQEGQPGQRQNEENEKQLHENLDFLQQLRLGLA